MKKEGEEEGGGGRGRGRKREGEEEGGGGRGRGRKREGEKKKRYKQSAMLQPSYLISSFLRATSLSCSAASRRTHACRVV